MPTYQPDHETTPEAWIAMLNAEHPGWLTERTVYAPNTLPRLVKAEREARRNTPEAEKQRQAFEAWSAKYDAEVEELDRLSQNVAARRKMHRDAAERKAMSDHDSNSDHDMPGPKKAWTTEGREKSAERRANRGDKIIAYYGSDGSIKRGYESTMKREGGVPIDWEKNRAVQNARSMPARKEVQDTRNQPIRQPMQKKTNQTNQRNYHRSRTYREPRPEQR